MDGSILFLCASLASFAITVDNPISERAREVGIPVLALLVLFFSPWSKLRHSGPVSNNLSEITAPQLPQTSSPQSRTVTKRLQPQMEQTVFGSGDGDPCIMFLERIIFSLQ